MWLYKITNKKNGKAYIGATITPVHRRINRHLHGAKHGKKTLIAQAMRTFGKDAFLVEILARAETQGQLSRMEMAAIRKHRTLAPNGYNRTVGGEHSRPRRGFHLSKEHRDKISRAHVGIKHSAQSRRAISEAKRGKTHAPISKAARKRISASLMGHSVSQETREKIAASLRARKGETVEKSI